MKPNETKHLYERACRTKRITPQEDEGRAWHKVLGSFEARDIETAVNAWWADTTPGRDGLPRGHWMPTPADLKPLVELACQRRLRESAEVKDLVGWRCHGCGLTCCGFTNATGPRPCRRCGAQMEEHAREKANRAVMA